MEHAIQNMQRRQSRQMALEEALRIGVLEASRRHSMHPNSRKAIILPPINPALMRAERRQSVHARSRAKSIAVLAMQETFAKDFTPDEMEEKMPLKLPKINGRRPSVVNEGVHWQLPIRRVSKQNDKIIVDHLRRRLLKQHERRVSLAFEEQSKAIEEEERSLNSRESYDEEAIRSLRSNHSRTLSHSTLNFSSTATSRVDVYQDNLDCVSRRLSEVSSVQEVTNQEIKQVDDDKPPIQPSTPPPKPRPKPPLTSRPSICISTDTGFTDWIDVDESDERKSKYPATAGDEGQGSVFQQSWSESEKSVTILMQQARRRSQLSEIPEVKSQRGIVRQQSTVALLSDEIPTSPSKDLLTSESEINVHNVQRRGSKPDQEVPIGEVSLFSDWLSPVAASPTRSRRESFMSDVTTLPDDVTNASLSRQNTTFTEPPCTPSPNPALKQHEISCPSPSPVPPPYLTPEDLRSSLLRIYHGDVTIHVPYVKRKVCIYISSAGLDTGVERNAIHDTLTSRLRHFCGERNVTLEVIDLNSLPSELCDTPLEAHASRVFVDSGHSLSLLRRSLVERAQMEGIGSTFMCFLTDGRNLHPTIPESLEPRVFDVIMGSIDDEINEIDMTILQMKRSIASGTLDSSDEKSKSSAGSQVYEKSTSSSVTSETVKSSNTTAASSSVTTRSNRESHETAVNTGNIEGQITAQREKLRRIQEKKNVLLCWYWLDENAKPPIYRLKSIKSQYKTYAAVTCANQRPDNEKVRREEQLWIQVKNRIRNILHHYSDPNLLGDHKPEERDLIIGWKKSILTPTVVEESCLALARGVISTSESCFWFHRQIADVNEMQVDDNSKYFLPVNQTNALDRHHVDSLKQFKADLVEQVGYTNHRDYPLAWNQLKQAYTSRDTGNVKNEDVRAWNLYLDRLRLDFYNVCTMQISNALERMQMNVENRNFATEEALDHVKFARDLAANCCDRKGVLKVIRGYLRLSRSRRPLVVYGGCGVGKSSVLSRAMTLINSWMTSSEHKTDFLLCRVIFRSVGVTGESTQPRTLLASICTQLRYIVDDIEEVASAVEGAKKHTAKINKPVPSKLKDLDFRSLSVKFTNLLKKFSRKEQPLCLFIDNLDGISNEHDARKLNWIPERLPKFVKLVVSMTARPPLQSSDTTPNNDCFESIRARCEVESDGNGEFPPNFIHVPPLIGKNPTHQNLPTSHSNEHQTSLAQVLDSEMNKFNRQLTAKQTDMLLDKCRGCPHPLAVAICASIASKWTSVERSDFCESQLPSKGETIEEFVHSMFRNFEENHGRALVLACACFLTSSLHGLTSSDMLCLLSLERNVAKWLGGLLERSALPDVGKRRSGGQKPVAGKVPNTKTSPKAKKTPEIAVEVKRLPAILWESLLSDLRFCLLETGADRIATLKWRHEIYSRVATIRYMSQPESRTYFHQLMSKYFSDQVASGTPGEHKHDTCQPLYWHAKHADISEKATGKETVSGAISSVETIHNVRRLNESCHHYLKSRDLSEIKSDLLCNYEWLLAKMIGVSFESLMENISAALSLHPGDNDLRLLAESLHLSRAVLKCDPSQLAAQLVGRLYLILKKDKPLARMDPRKYPRCRILIGQCRRSSLPVLVPSGTCLTTPGDILYDLHKGHRDVITAVAMTTDGQRAISASRDQTLKVWDLFSRRVCSTFTGISRHVTSLAVCMGNNYVIIVTGQNKVEVRCLRTFLCLLSLADSNDRLVACAAGDGLPLLVVICHTARVMKVWDLEKVRMLHKIDISPDHVTLRDDQSPLLARTSRSNNVLISYHSSDEAYVYNVRRPKHLNTMKLQSHNEYALITHVEVSREYYVIACKRQYMRLHEMVTFELYDSINFGHVRTIRACPEDSIIDVFVNRLGSHVIALCRGSVGSEVGVWNVETGKHQHMACQSSHSSSGCCVDLQYCVTIGDDDTAMRVHNLAARIDDKTLSRTQVKKESVGIGEFYPLASNSKYVVARGLDNGPITVWNITRGRCKGEAVSIERGLLEKNDVVVVKDVQVIILSDRGISPKDSSRHVFRTIFIYDLRTKKYSKKLHPVEITICPPNEYHVLGSDRLLAVSHDRSHFVIWSLISGMVMSHIPLDFSKYVIAENEAKENDKRRRRKRDSKAKPHREKTTKSNNTHSHSGGSPCHLTEDERSRLIDQAMLSVDESTLLCSFYGRHVAVIDVEEMRHIRTLTSKNSMLLLHQAKLTHRGCHLVHTNYDDVTKTSYLSVWNLRQGCVIRRLKNEPLVCGLAVCENASRIVFATEDNFIKIWEPFKKGSHRRIPGYEGLRMRRGEGKYPRTGVYLTKSATRAILFAHDISLWDLEREYVISKFTPDVPFSCCTIAMNGHLIIAGLQDVPQVVTLRLMSRDLDARQYGRSALGDAVETSMFGEKDERDSESSGDELLDDE